MKRFVLGLICLCGTSLATPDEVALWNQKYQKLESVALRLLRKQADLKRRLNQLPARYPSIVSVCEGRLTLTSNTPVTTSDVSGGTLYYTPFRGTTCSFYNTTGSNWYNRPFTQTSLTLSVSSGVNYDVYFLDSSGTFSLTTVAWSSDTARNGADTIALQDGVYVRSNDRAYRYLGTIRASSANTVTDSSAQRFIWNYQNQMMRPISYTAESTDSWSYATNSWRQARATAGNRVEAVFGLSEAFIHLYSLAPVTNGTGALNYYASGIGVDSTTVNSSYVFGAGTSDLATVQASSEYFGYPGAGYHAFNWLEIAPTTAVTVWGDNADSTKFQSGLLGYFFG